MIRMQFTVLSAALALASIPAAAQTESGGGEDRPGAELAVGVLRHGANFHPLGSSLSFDLPPLPPGQVYDGMEENGTADVQLLYRTAPLGFALKPRLAAKAQISLEGRTSFASVGAEWRQHVLGGRVYGQVGIGLTIHDGYRFTPDPFAPGLPIDEARRRFAIYQTQASFGSRVLFNPNASVGVRLSRKWAAELVWEHHSHAQVFSDQNPGIDHVGLRLVRSFEGKR